MAKMRKFLFWNENGDEKETEQFDAAMLRRRKQREREKRSSRSRNAGAFAGRVRRSHASQTKAA